MADPQVVEPRALEPGHAPRRRPPPPRPLGRRALQPRLRGRRRGARLPRRLRLARRQRAAPAPPNGARVRSRPAVPARLGDDREPGAARPGARRSRLHRRRGRRRAACRADDRALEPAAARRRARRPRERARRSLAADGTARRARPADALLREEPQVGRADPPLHPRPARPGVPRPPFSLPRRLHPRAAPADRTAARGRRAARRLGDRRTRARDRHRPARLRDLDRLPGHGGKPPAAVGPRRTPRPRARGAGRQRGRPRPVLHARARDAAAATRRGGDPRPRESTGPRRARALGRVRGAARRRRPRRAR